MNNSVTKLLFPEPIYSIEFKQMVCEYYLNGKKSKEEIRKEFGIKGKSTLLYWLRQLGYAKSVIKTTIGESIMKEPQKEADKNLEKENEDLKLQLEIYKRMISIAEKEFKIDIVKKSDTKQSKR